MNKLPHRQLIVSVGLIQRNEKFLLTRRVHHNNPEWHHRWELPGGKIDQGETPLEALHREILEETGLSIYSPRLLGVYTQHWTIPDKGVQQTFVLLYHCRANEGEVSLRPNEHDAFVWETLEQIYKKEHLLSGTTEMIKGLYQSLD